MKLLALDTATEFCSVALWLEGELHERVEAGNQHSSRLLPMIEALLAEAGLPLGSLDALAFGRGPGSFTGLRLGAGVVQGLALGADLGVVPVSSLAALAQGQAQDQVLAALDARMGQVYWAAYQRDHAGLMRLQREERVCAPEDVPHAPAGRWQGAGSGWQVYGTILSARLGDALVGYQGHAIPQAAQVAVLGVAGLTAGEAVSADLALPVYVRDQVAKKASEQA